MKALTVGGAMIDTIAIIESDRIERMTMFNADSSFLLMEEGRKTEALEISTHCGGGAVNAAVSLARLGNDVGTLVKLGRDERAETLLARLMQEGVSARWAIRDARAPTGASVLVSSHDRNAAIFTFRGANTLLEPEDLKTEAFAVDLVYISNLSNKSADCFPAIIEKAKAQGALVAANPGVRQLSARGGTLHECLSSIDILVVNRSEADVLVPGLVAEFGEGGPSLPTKPGETLPALAVRGLRSGGFYMSLLAFFKALQKRGARTVVITDGRGGAFVGTREAITYCPSLLTDVVGTTGAGDAFASTLSAFIALQRPVEEALRAAAINSASVVMYADTQTGLLSKDAIASRLETSASQLAIKSWKI